jgi:hypothetical protein
VQVQPTKAVSFHPTGVFDRLNVVHCRSQSLGRCSQCCSALCTILLLLDGYADRVVDHLAVGASLSGYRRSQHYGVFEDIAKQLSGRLACPFRWRPRSLSTTCLPGKRSGDHLRQLILEHAFAQRVRCGAVTDGRKASDSATYRRTIVAFH